jgi:hypothetical protein
VPRTMRDKVKVVMQLPEGYTKVLVERTYGLGIADGGIYVEVPSKIIPPYLRAIGSRFVLVTTPLTGTETSTPDQIRQAETMAVEEIEDE